MDFEQWWDLNGLDKNSPNANLEIALARRIWNASQASAQQTHGEICSCKWEHDDDFLYFVCREIEIENHIFILLKFCPLCGRKLRHA